MSELDTLLSKAVAETKQLEQGEVFYVRDLFKGYKWNRIPRKTRIMLGTLFLNYVKSNSCGIKPDENSTAGQRCYIVG